jgi:hypothetical protein
MIPLSGIRNGMHWVDMVLKSMCIIGWIWLYVAFEHTGGHTFESSAGLAFLWNGLSFLAALGLHLC